MTDELATAIEAVKRATPENALWSAEDFSEDENPPEIDLHIATILNAVVSGDLAEVIALRAEVDRLSDAHDTVCGALAEAVKRANAAEADAERLAEALHNAHAGGLPHDIRTSVIYALAAHTQRVNASKG